MMLGERQAIVADILNLLTPREQLVIRSYYYEDMTLEEVGRLIDTGPTQVMFIRNRAINKMRHGSKSVKLRGVC